MIWKIWKKGKLNSVKIRKIWNKSKLNSKKIWKIWKNSKLNSEIDRLDSNLSILAMIAASSPYIGLFGTVE
jgi:biopolymer transport protein TolQ